MPSTLVRTVTLERHPESRDGAAVRSIAVRVRRQPGGTLALRYSIEGDVSRLRVPPPGTSRVAQALWRHTCCECFIALPGASGYHEFNFSPSMAWAAYAFTAYRDGAPLGDKALEPRIEVRRNATMLELDASLPLLRLSPDYANGALRLALSAVIEETNGALSYWALAHPAGKPDFHHPGAFVLELRAMEDCHEVRD